MPKLPVVSGEEVIKALAKVGFSHIHTTGSHAILKREDATGKKVIPVPLHNELAKGTLISIMHQSGLNRDEFLDLF